MTWERLFDVFEDLEQQAEGLALAERDAEVAELARAEYAEVDLMARVHASVGVEVELTLRGGEVLRGVVSRAGRDWCLLAPRGELTQALVPIVSVSAARGLSARAVRESARPLPARLGLGSVLRRLADEGGRIVLQGADGTRRPGTVLRVGADFLELAGDSGVVVVPLAAVTVLRR